MKKIWYRILNILFSRCPECGSKTNNVDYGEYCINNDCNWIEYG